MEIGLAIAGVLAGLISDLQRVNDINKRHQSGEQVGPDDLAFIQSKAERDQSFVDLRDAITRAEAEGR
jgi:hypothetical protein